MSLLLEALKKAERAKEEAQRRARGEPELVEPPPLPEQPVLTRDQLPDIRQALALEGDEPPAKPAPPAQRESPPQREAAPAARPAATADGDAGARASARKVFEAKFREPNPRLPFYITMGALGVFAVGTVVYFWIQLQPPPTLVNRNPPPPAGETQVAAADLKPTPRPAPQVPAAAIPGLPATAPSKPAPPAALQAPAPAPVQRAQAPMALPAIPRAPEIPRLQAPRPPSATEITSSRAAPQVHPNITTGYAAYVAGDLAGARTEYQHALREEPTNRDALLGIAALDVRAGRFEHAEAGYLRLLQADPRDSHALAALIALRAGRTDPVAAESRVKSVLADNPGSHVLNFTLGNQLAQQGRWAEAQQEYFKAFAAEPDNADFAYNLAVSLEHLRQPKLALEYYRRALALAKMRGASFALAAAESRVAQLGR
jgi:tetratricopeptide (TPR) repeat protein